MIDKVIDLLKDDSALRSLLEASLDDSHIEALSTSIIDAPALVYTISPIVIDGVKEVYKLELRAMAADIQTTINIIERVNELLLTLGDNSLSNDILSIDANGGGMMETDIPKRYHQFIFLNITRRK